MNQLNLQFSSENEDRNQTARILTLLIWFSWAAYFIVVIGGLFWTSWNMILATLIGSVFLLIPYGLIKRGYILASGYLLVFMILGTVTWLATIGQGIHDIVILAFPIIIVFASLTLNQFGFKIIVSLTILSVAWLVFGESFGLFVSNTYETPNWMDFLIILAILMVAALAVNVMTTRLQKNFDKAKLEIEQCIKTEEEVEKREKRFQALIEHGRDSISLLAADGTLLWESPSAGITLGYKSKQFVGRNIFELMHPDDLAWTQEMYAYIVQTPGNIREGEFRLLHANGDWRWIECSATNLLDEPGVHAVVLNYRDITERKVVEEALQKSQDLYMNLVESQTDLICRWLPDTTVIYANNAYCDYFGKSSEEIIGDRFKSWLPGETQDIVQDTIDRLLRREEKRYIIEEININPQGHKRWVSWAYNPITNKNGEIIEFQSVGRDITERKQIEEALQEKEIQYRNLADSGTALIWKSGTDKLCNYFNIPWLRFTGRTLEQEMGNGWAEGVHPEDFDRCLKTYISAFDKQEAFEMDYRLRHSSGEYRWIQDLGTPNYNSNNEFVGYIGHCFDITERKRAEDQLRYQSMHDALTGIYNRTFFEEELVRFERSREFPISVIIGDVDGLKQVNDTRGHATGDELLKQAANVLGSVFRAEDVLARIGGDEFAILLPKTDFPSLENMVSRIKERILEYNKIHPDLQVHLSLGAATAETDDLVSTFKLADQRMYADKSNRISNPNH